MHKQGYNVSKWLILEASWSVILIISTSVSPSSLRTCVQNHLGSRSWVIFRFIIFYSKKCAPFTHLDIVHLTILKDQVWERRKTFDIHLYMCDHLHSNISKVYATLNFAISSGPKRVDMSHQKGQYVPSKGCICPIKRVDMSHLLLLILHNEYEINVGSLYHDRHSTSAICDITIVCFLNNMCTYSTWMFNATRWLKENL